MAQESIGGHTILRRICQTASSELFVVADRRRREEVVLKVVLPKFARDKKILKHYAREAEVCGMMDHPNLVKVYDYVDSAERPYIVMQYVPGQMLKGAIYREAELVRRLGFHWLVRTSQALGHMHSRGVVHLDVKPENILVTDNGNATLIDLALSQPIGKPGLLKSLRTRLTGETAGTRSYMSPEQITGAALGPSADVYSLGIVVFEMFARRLPLTATDPNAILQLHLKVPPPMLHHVVPEIHPELSQLVARMLEKTPETRPQTMEVVIDTLARIGKPFLTIPAKAPR